MSVQRTILLFPTTHAVMHAGHILEGAGVDHEIIPRPKGVNADCGIAISVSPDDRERSVEALRQGGREPSRVMELARPERP